MKNPRVRGKRGELLAESFLLEWLTLASPVIDVGEDYIGWLNQEGSMEIQFAFQVKMAKRFPVPTKWLRPWIQDIECRPIIFLNISLSDTGTPIYRFLVLFDWLLAHPKWPERIQGKKTIHLSLNSFRDATVDFEKVLQREYHRVERVSTSIWRTRRSRSLALCLGDLLHHFGRLAAFQVPAAVLQELSNTGHALSEEQAYQFFHTQCQRVGNGSEMQSLSTATLNWLAAC